MVPAVRAEAGIEPSGLSQAPPGFARSSRGPCVRRRAFADAPV